MSEDEVRLADAAFREFAEMTATNEAGRLSRPTRQCGDCSNVDH